MRLTTDFWVSALIRRTFDTGGFAAVEVRGAGEAGAVFITCRDRFGHTDLYGPAPQASYGDDRPADRLFVAMLREAGEAELEARLAKERRFDTDAWIVALEPGRTAIADLIQLTGV